MKKQLLFILMTLLPMMANADESGTCGDNLTWTYYESTHSLVIAGSGDMYNYDLGNAPWKKYCGDIFSVILPEGLKTIGQSAFYYCSGLTSLTIPNSVISIGSVAFYCCSGLTSINIPVGVTAIGDWAFSGCSGLTSVTIPNSVKSIGYEAFSYCSGLSAVYITDLEAWCMISFNAASSNPLYYAHLLFLNGEEIKALIIPNSVASIGDYAFYGCSGLTSVTIPNSVTSIGNYAFSSCSGLTSVTIPNSVTSIGNYAFYGCSGLTSVTIPNSVTSIGNYAFCGCSGLTSVTIPNSVTSIGNYAFSGCSGLTSVTIGNSVTSIGGNAFSGCSGLTSVTIPNSVTSIGDYAFYGCSGLTSVTIGNSVTSIGGNAFSGCSGLTSVTIPNSVTSIGAGAFYECSSLTSVTIPKSVTEIGRDAFSGCSRISSVYISDISAWCKIKNKDYNNNPIPIIPSSHHLYLNGVEVEQLTIPNDITSLENYTFYGCSYITSINIPNSVTSIGESAFSGCSRVTSLTLPDNLMMIKKQTFQNCSNLQKLVIPASVQYIYQEAFSGCNALTEVVAQSETPPFVYNDTFSNYNCTLKVPDAGKDAYLAHEIWSKFNKIQTLSGEDIENPKCATPSISYGGKKLTFGCATEGVEYVYTIKDADVKTGNSSEVSLTATYEISVYATKTGYENSDVATATLVWNTATFTETTAPTAVRELTNSHDAPLLIQSNNGVITIQGADDGQQVRVYSINGTEAGTAVSSNGQATVGTNLKAGSVAIIKIGDRSFKVAIK